MISKSKCIAILLVLSTCLFGCAAEQPVEPDLTALKATIAKFYEGVETGNTQQVFELFSDSAFILPNGGRVAQGSEAIERMWQPGTDSGFRLKDIEVLELHASCDVAYEIHTYYWGMVREGEETEWHKTKNVHIWRMQPDGTWKLHVDIWNGTPEATQSP